MSISGSIWGSSPSNRWFSDWSRNSRSSNRSNSTISSNGSTKLILDTSNLTSPRCRIYSSCGSWIRLNEQINWIRSSEKSSCISSGSCVSSVSCVCSVSNSSDSLWSKSSSWYKSGRFSRHTTPSISYSFIGDHNTGSHGTSNCQ